MKRDGFARFARARVFFFADAALVFAGAAFAPFAPLAFAGAGAGAAPACAQSAARKASAIQRRGRATGRAYQRTETIGEPQSAAAA
jgi:hypothetical protein